jgi:hypothetical protein
LGDELAAAPSILNRAEGYEFARPFPLT